MAMEGIFFRAHQSHPRFSFCTPLDARDGSLKKRCFGHQVVPNMSFVVVEVLRSGTSTKCLALVHIQDARCFERAPKVRFVKLRGCPRKRHRSRIDKQGYVMLHKEAYKAIKTLIRMPDRKNDRSVGFMAGSHRSKVIWQGTQIKP